MNKIQITSYEAERGVRGGSFLMRRAISVKNSKWLNVFINCGGRYVWAPMNKFWEIRAEKRGYPHIVRLHE